MTASLSLSLTDDFADTVGADTPNGRAASAVLETKPFPLTMAGEGERVRIHSLQGGKGLAKRLTELGLNQGADIQILQRQGCGLVVGRGETRIALGGGMATKILVEVIGR